MPETGTSGLMSGDGKRSDGQAVNIIDCMTAVYAWEGALNEGDEVVAIIKTRKCLFAHVTDAVCASHPNTNPAVIVIDIAGGSDAYLSWMIWQTYRISAGLQFTECGLCQRGLSCVPAAGTVHRPCAVIWSRRILPAAHTPWAAVPGDRRRPVR